jgi:hypothetical protein
LTDAGRIGTAKLIDTLLDIGQRDQPAVLAQRRDHAPFVKIDILELVENDNGVAIGKHAAEAGALLQKIGPEAGKQIEAE